MIVKIHHRDAESTEKRGKEEVGELIEGVAPD